MVAEISGGGDGVRRFVLTEMAVSAVINGVITALAAWLTFSGGDPVPVWGLGGVAFDLLPSTFIPVAAMGLILPLVIKARRRAAGGGGVPEVEPRDLDRWLGPWAGIARRPEIARAPLTALVWTCLFVPAGAAALWASGAVAIPLTAVLTGKALWGAVVGAGVCPLVVLPAALR